MDPPQGSPRFVDDHLPSLLARAAHAVSAELHDRLRRRGVPVPVWRVLATLSDGPETVTALAEDCLLQQPTMTKLLDRMERDGLVRREQDGRDRRLVRIHLTPRGQAIFGELLAAARAYEAEILARHPEAGRVKDLLRALIARQGRRIRPRG
jgi:DNA-binding MarR family transcriptional regulator